MRCVNPLYHFPCILQNPVPDSSFKCFTIFMYSIINKAARNLLFTHHGKETWQQVKRKAAAEHEMFISTKSHPDEVTHKFIGATSEVLEQSTGKILKIFGCGRLLTIGGRTLEEFVKNLPNFQTRVVMMFPAQQSPRFDCTEVKPTVAERLILEVKITHEASKGCGENHDAIQIAWKESKAR